MSEQCIANMLIGGTHKLDLCIKGRYQAIVGQSPGGPVGRRAGRPRLGAERRLGEQHVSPFGNDIGQDQETFRMIDLEGPCCMSVACSIISMPNQYVHTQHAHTDTVQGPSKLID